MYWLVTPGWSTSWTAAANIVDNISMSLNTFYDDDNNNNKTTVYSRLHPQCRILMNSTKQYNSCLTSNWCHHLVNFIETSHHA